MPVDKTKPLLTDEQKRAGYDAIGEMKYVGDARVTDFGDREVIVQLCDHGGEASFAVFCHREFENGRTEVKFRLSGQAIEAIYDMARQVCADNRSYFEQE